MKKIKTQQKIWKYGKRNLLIDINYVVWSILSVSCIVQFSFAFACYNFYALQMEKWICRYEYHII